MLNEVSIEIINKCLNKCVHCSSSSTLESPEIMPFSLLESVISGLSSLGVKEISLSGGEPLLHPDITEIVQCATKHNIMINIYSCGIIYTKDRFESISIKGFGILKNAGLSRIMFNLQAANERIYDEISDTKGFFPLVIQSIRNSVIAELPTEIHFVPMKINKGEISNIIKFGEQENIDQVSFLKLVPHGRARVNTKRIMLDESEDLSVQKELFNSKEKGARIRIGIPYSTKDNCSTCHAIRKKLYIRYDGCVFGCEAFKYIDFGGEDGNPILPDNVYSTSIEEIVNGSLYLNKSKELVDRYVLVKSKAENCPVQKYLKEMRMK